MFANRLEIQSPGGLFGTVNLENLEEEHSTRNARLMRIMEDMHVVENRGSGIRAMLHATREANLEPPRFEDRRASFLVILHNHTLMNPEAIAWLNQFAGIPLNDRQRLTLVYLRQKAKIDNADYRRLNRVDSAVAGQELRDLVLQGLVEQHGVGRWTHYKLSVPGEVPETGEVQIQSDEDKVLAFAREKGAITNEQCRDLLNINQRQATYLLSKLVHSSLLVMQGKGRWSFYRLI